ncbi:28S ribosomal protein S18a, mitochondrial, partial [Armadillidium nasatum]
FYFSKQINKMLIHQPIRTIPTFIKCFQRTNLFKSPPLYNFFGATSLQIHTSSPRFLKEIVTTEDNNVITIEGKYVESPRQGQLVKNPIEDKKVCVLCALNLNLKHTDVLILSQFLRSDGCILPRRITGLCKRQQKIVTYLVAMAQKAGLMPNLNPKPSKMDPELRYGPKKYKRYFIEDTIREYSFKYKTKPESDYYPLIKTKPPPVVFKLTPKKLTPN